MTTKELAHRWFDQVWNQRNVATITEMMHPDVLGDAETGAIRGRAQFVTDHYNRLITAFPDLRVQIQGITAEGDEAVLRWTATGTHSGPLLELSPTGRKFSIAGMSWMRFEKGKLVEGWDRWNASALFNLLRTGVGSHTVRAVS